MAYSGSAQVLEFTLVNSIAVNTSAVDVSASSGDFGAIIVPVPMMLYQFGCYVTESLAAAVTGSIFLERADFVAGTDATVVELDLDATDLRSGDGTRAAQTASTGSEDIDAGDVIYSPQTSFPIIITAPQVLVLRTVQTSSVAGELRPFIICRWLGPDYRSTEVWINKIGV